MPIQHDEVTQIVFKGAEQTTQPKSAIIEVTMSELNHLILDGCVEVRPTKVREAVIQSLAKLAPDWMKDSK